MRLKIVQFYKINFSVCVDFWKKDKENIDLIKKKSFCLIRSKFLNICEFKSVKILQTF